MLLPIHVGALISDTTLPMQRDDDVAGKPCCNISAKNKNYCELTALYWAWKNIKTLYPDIEYVGLCHYRRYFDFDEPAFTFGEETFKPVCEVTSYKVDKKKLERILQNYSIIIRKRKFLQHSVQTAYNGGHVSGDMRTLIKVISELHPEYLQSVIDVWLCGNKFTGGNLAIMRWDLFESYCEWLFSLLSECEKRIDISTYSAGQARIFGYMGERLLDVWVDHQEKHGQKVKCLDSVKYCDEKTFRPHISWEIRKRLAYWLITPHRKSTKQAKLKEILRS